ncbi:glycosyltransferase [Aridibaculum aurantiacum]|uniref:glycosyltransferase n=1 Tax=Aridibaculum aurantiacum TaxID=2810307 RepID=UPI001A970350|nr:glycosyltransferase [Aridibaculum aurantiacum]
MANQEKQVGTKVSVIMCTHNGAKYVKEQLTSILHQTYPLHELLVFDDMSTDDTVEIIQETIQDYPFAKLHRNETNLGFTKNFETAFKAATGDVIAVSDQDDVWIKEKIERMLKAWKPEKPAIYCNSILFRGAVPKKIHPNRRLRKYKGTDARKIFLGNTVSGHALMIRREFLDLVLPFKEGIMYDWWIGVVASYNGGLQYVPEVLVLQRGHEKNISVDFTKRSLVENVIRHKKEAIKHCKAFAEAPNIPEGHRQYAVKFAVLLEESLSQKFSMPLFLFIVNNRNLVFHYKQKKLLSFFSYLKHSYRFSLGMES